MISCCSNCYVKYITKDKEGEVIDKEFLVDNYGEDYEISVEYKEIDKSFMDFLLKRKEDLPKTTYIISNNIKTKLCTCICHVHGMSVMH